MENSYKYNVAGHVFQVMLPQELTQEAVLKPYLPFICTDASEPVFTLKMEYTDKLTDYAEGYELERMNDEAPYFWLLKREENLRFGFSNNGNGPEFIILAAGDFSEAVVHVPRTASGPAVEFALSNSLMLMYTFRTSPYDTLMTHASVIRYNDGGYMFLGRSGTGKSTHSRMWLENIEGAVLLNDDNPIVRVIDGKAYIYGSPWSGKTPCYKNEVVPLKAVVRISQAPYNKIERLSALKSYASLKPSCSCMKWDKRSTDALHESVEKVISIVPCWLLECLPDAEAAYTCHAAVTYRS